MVELLDVSKAENIYSSLIRHTINGKKLNLRFGIVKSDYARLKRILEFRPFENTGFAPYRYFFALSYGPASENDQIALTSIRVEQLDRNKQYEFELSKKYISNILWFDKMTDKTEIEQLIEK
ncbi:hypothetical protein [Maribacter halichondriae]|uniref:hypothetical protein n=1 Tax=Maribacter halichondriae TaxID=2980554 RepID=UPI002359041F|nr:hypothetical protein [Maribacter sp. Hal144]